MFAIGCATNDERAFRASGARTIESLDEGSALLLRRHRYDTIDAPYNEMLDTALASCEGSLEGVVLVHQDAHLETSEEALADIGLLMVVNPEVAVVGAVDDGVTRRVGLVDGTLIALSPWAVRTLRFDPSVGDSVDALAYDISLQAQAADRCAAAVPLGIVRAPTPVDRAARMRRLRAMAALRRKWGKSLDERLVTTFEGMS